MERIVCVVVTDRFRPLTGDMMKLLMGYPRAVSAGVDGDGGNKPYIKTLF